MRPNKPWFRPIPSFFKVAAPVTWEGITVTVAFVLGIGLLRLVDDPVRRAIGLALLAIGYGAVVILTWSKDPD